MKAIVLAARVGGAASIQFRYRQLVSDQPPGCSTPRCDDLTQGARRACAIIVLFARQADLMRADPRRSVFGNVIAYLQLRPAGIANATNIVFSRSDTQTQNSRHSPVKGMS